MKTKKRYENCKAVNINDEMRMSIKQMLKDMTTSIAHVINNQDYLRMYYPIDDALRNKGSLTLTSTSYVKYFSMLLKLAKAKYKNITSQTIKFSPFRLML